MNMQDERARVLIIDRETGRIRGECKGSAAYGLCPQSVDGRPVPCAGCRVVPLQGTGVEGWTLTVADDATDSCPLAFVPVRDGR